MNRPSTHIYVFDISRALNQLRMDNAPLEGYVNPEVLVDDFVKHTIACFQVVSVLGYRIDYLRPSTITWFNTQVEAAHELWRSIRLPVEVSGEEVLVHRVGDRVWIVIPNR